MAKGTGFITVINEMEPIHVMLSNEAVSITTDKNGSSPVMRGTSTVVLASQGTTPIEFAIASISALVVME